VLVAGVVAYLAPASGQADGEAAPIFGVKIPSGYRDWKLISVAHEEGALNDLRAILGNDVAITASQEGPHAADSQACPHKVNAYSMIPHTTSIGSGTSPKCQVRHERSAKAIRPALIQHGARRPASSFFLRTR
jgi:hypothetical protein